MIPKKIHYVWVGGNPLTKLAEKCIESWQKNCPDYEIVRWDESNFNIDENIFCKQAYENKKWAFVSDYIRLKVLYEHGGIYMDTDVEVLKPLDNYLSHHAFSGFEVTNYIPTGIIAAKKHNTWIKLMLDYYNERPFVKKDGTYENMPNVVFMSELTKANYDMQFNDEFQDLGDIVFYPHDYFCPSFDDAGKCIITESTVTIHHFAGSWLPKKMKLKKKVNLFIKKIFIFFFGRKTLSKLKNKLGSEEARREQMYNDLKKEKSNNKK